MFIVTSYQVLRWNSVGVQCQRFIGSVPGYILPALHQKYITLLRSFGSQVAWNYYKHYTRTGFHLHFRLRYLFEHLTAANIERSIRLGGNAEHRSFPNASVGSWKFPPLRIECWMLKIWRSNPPWRKHCSLPSGGIDVESSNFAALVHVIKYV